MPAGEIIKRDGLKGRFFVALAGGVVGRFLCGEVQRFEFDARAVELVGDVAFELQLGQEREGLARAIAEKRQLHRGSGERGQQGETLLFVLDGLAIDFDDLIVLLQGIFDKLARGLADDIGRGHGDAELRGRAPWQAHRFDGGRAVIGFSVDGALEGDFVFVAIVGQQSGESHVVESGDGIAVDGQELIAHSQSYPWGVGCLDHAGFGGAGRGLVRPDDFRIGGGESRDHVARNRGGEVNADHADRHEHHRGEDNVHHHARSDHDQTLADGLGVVAVGVHGLGGLVLRGFFDGWGFVGVFGVIALFSRGEVFLSQHFDVAADGQCADAVVGIASDEAEQARSHADGESVDADPRPAGSGEVAQFVEEDHDIDADEELYDRPNGVGDDSPEACDHGNLRWELRANRVGDELSGPGVGVEKMV